MQRGSRFSTVILLVLVAFTPFGSQAAPAAHRKVALIGQDRVTMRQDPGRHARPIAVLDQQTQVEVLGVRHGWTEVRIWDSVRGWVATRDLVAAKPRTVTPTYHAPKVRLSLQPVASTPLTAIAVTTAATTLFSHSGIDRTLAAGARVQVTAWRQTVDGKVWYRIGKDWALGDTVQFLASAHDPTGWKRIAGKGMWLTLGPIVDVDPAALVSAALHNGVTHLYLEAAISPLGFHGKHAVGPLLEEAHAHHIRVIAWVYPYLYDLASDVVLTRQVAAFRSARGQQFDGIAADLERNVQTWNLRAYSQLVREYLGRHYLLVGVTYGPRASPNYPFAEAARSYDVIAPMDYWHETTTRFGLDYGHMAYGYHYGYLYAQDSIRGIQQIAGSGVRVAPIGQTFDDFSRLELGPHAPSAAEVRGFMAGSKASGAVGVSFFQWGTATVDEWRTIAHFRY